MAFSGLRFPNLSVIVDKRIPSRGSGSGRGKGKGKEWCCIDLLREQLFNFNGDDDTAAPPQATRTFHHLEKYDPLAKVRAILAKYKDVKYKDDKMMHMLKRMRRATLLPSPNMKYPAPASKKTKINWNVDFLPLAGRNLLRVHDSGRTVLTLGAGPCVAKTLPDLQTPKRSPLTMLVPSSDGDNGIGSILVMERSPVPFESHQLEAFVYCGISESWERLRLPPPPFPFVWHRPTIRSYAVVPAGASASASASAGAGAGADSHSQSHVVCISVDVDGVSGAGTGTYCFDTGTHAWTKVGNWKLPFIGRAEYVKELNLWFGICPTPTTTTNKGVQFQLGAADLSTMSASTTMPAIDSLLSQRLQQEQKQQEQEQQQLPQPQLVGTWNELMMDDDAHPPLEGWTELRRPQFVNLGSGRFCIARFFFHHARAVMEMKEPTRLSFGDHEHGEESLFTTTVFTGAHVKHTTTDDEDDKLHMITHNSIRHVPDDKYGNIQLVF